MNFYKLLSFLCIVSIFSIKLINCSEDYYESDYEISDLSLNSSLSLNDSLAINGTDDDYYDDYEEDEEECTVDTFIEHYSQLLLPEDYEEGKQLDFKQMSYSYKESIARIKRLNQYQKNVTKKLEPILKRVMPRFSEWLFYIDLPSDCMASLVRIGQAAKNGEQWAMKFMDSMPSGKVHSSQINSPPLGKYDECLSIESPDTNDSEKPKIFGHYCSLGMPTNMVPDSNEDHIEDFRRLEIMYMNKMKEYRNGTNKRETDGKLVYDIIRLLEYLGGDEIRSGAGLCLPSTCNPKDVEYAINKILFPMTRFNMIIHPDCDYRDKPVHIDKYQIISIISIVLITLVCVICTTIWLLRDRFFPKDTIDGQPMTTLFRITDCFSIIPNLKAIFDTSKGFEKFSALDGIRAILCFWIFVFHQYMSGGIVLHTKKMRQSASFKLYYQYRYMLLSNWNVTDTFFLMGGFMTCYILLSKLEKSRGKFNYIQYAIYRYFRMIPIILTAIAITFVLELIGDGPLWPLISHLLQKSCVDNYLPTILMYNNYLSAPQMVSCVQVSWYSSADFQLYLMAPVIILVLYHWPRVGLIWNIIVVILGMLLAVAPKLWFGVPHYFQIFTSQNLNLDLLAQVFSRYYFGTEGHVQTYTLGILVGFVLRKYPNLYLGGRWGEVLIWLSTWTLTFYAMFWHQDYLNYPEYRVTESEVINWIAFSKISYTAGWCWAFYACCTGRAGFINKFFSWKGFKPIAYLMLEIYILHIFIITYRIGTTRELVFYSDYYVWTIAIFDFILVFILALIVNVLVTKPLANLLNLFMKSSNKKEILDDINNNNLKFNSNGKQGSDEDNISDVIVMKNVAFDSGSVVLTDKQLIIDKIFQNLDNSNTNDCNTDCNKESALKM